MLKLRITNTYYIVNVTSYITNAFYINNIINIAFSTEAIYVEIGPQTKPKIFVIVAYIPPDAAPYKINHLAKFVETIFKSMRDIDNIILVGDFNFSNIQWERDKKNEPSCIPSKISSVYNKFDILVNVLMNVA